MTPDGIDVEHLERVLERLKKRGEIRRLKMLYLVSYYQNPTGRRRALRRRRRR